MRDKTPVSASQQRILTLLGIARQESYSAAKEAIQSAGHEGSGIPAGHTWRSAKQLTDAAILAKTKLILSDGDEVNDMFAGPQF